MALPAEPVVAEADQPLLSLRGITKSFGPVQALTDVDLDVPAGQVTALVGDNGAGKSVLIKTIAGIHAPDHGSGRVEVGPAEHPQGLPVRHRLQADLPGGAGGRGPRPVPASR